MKTTYSKTIFTKLLTVAVLGASLVGVTGCDLASNFMKSDREAELEIQDYRDGLAPRDPDLSDFSDTSIPSLQPYIADVPENTKAMPLVSISVNQTVPLRDVLFELAEQADYDLELDPNITGAIIFTARNRPLDEVIDRISETAGLRYKFINDTLRIENDTPYNKTYKIDYLSYIRSTSGSVNNAIGLSSGDAADTNTGSQFSTSTSSEADFWGELEVNVGQILGRGTATSLRTSNDPRITAVDQNPNVAPVAAGGAAGGGVNVQSPDVTLQVESLPVDTQTSNQQQNTAASANGAFSVNRQAGLITVYASERLHKQVQEYLSSVRKAVTAQVLIEAKILEVSLSDRFAAGIDWRLVNPGGEKTALNFLSEGFGALDTIAGGNGQNVAFSPFSGNDIQNSFILGYAGADAQAFVNALSAFGTVRALASPRLTVLNNQAAVLNVATNRVYFEVDIDVSEGNDNNPSRVTVDSNARNVPEGVLVNVQPSINLDNNTISMAVRPTITRIVNSVEDPGVQFIAGANGIDISNQVPEVNVQEIDSVINVRSGQPVVMGGLLQDRVETGHTGVPVLSEVPVFGNLFKDREDNIEKTELVILLKATVVPSGDGSVDNTDKDLYRTFSSDRHPFKL
ncbi:MAG: type II and III secretion system family protein [Alphaproteobacteria bacterium]|nr:type II and III secretion system family protein [Alphaproteobacteria bacterium]